MDLGRVGVCVNMIKIGTKPETAKELINVPNLNNKKTNNQIEDLTTILIIYLAEDTQKSNKQRKHVLDGSLGKCKLKKNTELLLLS